MIGTDRKRRIIRHRALASLSYREPMPVTRQHTYHNGDRYYMCPRCGITLEREFCRFCDRCGQRLNWSHYRTSGVLSARSG